MPELPESKIIVRRIRSSSTNKRIVDFNISNLKLKSGKIADFKKKIIGSRIKKINCLGQSIIIKLTSGYYILVNMQSTGFFTTVLPQKHNPKHIRATFTLASGSKLFFIDSRGYSYFKLLNQKQLNKEMLEVATNPLSPEFSYKAFLNIIKRRTTAIKSLLVNSKVIFGLGKVYSDEICFEARIRPDKSIGILRTSEKRRLYSAIRKVLKKSLEYDGLSFYLPISSKKIRFDRFLRVYKRTGKKCHRCRTGIIKKEKVGSHNSFFCPNCQN